MKKFLTSALVIASLVAQSGAYAADAGVAQISVAKGTVLVDRGDGFKAVSGTVKLSEGNRVAVADGEARITQATGCSAALPAQTMLTISKDMGCLFKVSDRTEKVEITAQGEGAFGTSTTTYIVAFFVVIVIGLGITFAVTEDERRSP